MRAFRRWSRALQKNIPNAVSALAHGSAEWTEIHPYPDTASRRRPCGLITQLRPFTPGPFKTHRKCPLLPGFARGNPPPPDSKRVLLTIPRRSKVISPPKRPARQICRCAIHLSSVRIRGAASIAYFLIEQAGTNANTTSGVADSFRACTRSRGGLARNGDSIGYESAY